MYRIEVREETATVSRIIALLYREDYREACQERAKYGFLCTQKPSLHCVCAVIVREQ